MGAVAVAVALVVAVAVAVAMAMAVDVAVAMVALAMTMACAVAVVRRRPKPRVGRPGAPVRPARRHRLPPAALVGTPPLARGGGHVTTARHGGGGRGCLQRLLGVRLELLHGGRGGLAGQPAGHRRGTQRAGTVTATGTETARAGRKRCGRYTESTGLRGRASPAAVGRGAQGLSACGLLMGRWSLLCASCRPTVGAAVGAACVEEGSCARRVAWRSRTVHTRVQTMRSMESFLLYSPEKVISEATV